MIGPPLTPLEQQILRDVAERAQSQAAAERVWVFGSRARAASDEWSDLDIAVEFSTGETPALRAWLDGVRRDVEEPLLPAWAGLIDLVGLYAGDFDPRLARQVHADGRVVWERVHAGAAA